MSTWDYMTPADYAACRDAGRVPSFVEAGISPDELADMIRDEEDGYPLCGLCGMRRPAPGMTACSVCA